MSKDYLRRYFFILYFAALTFLCLTILPKNQESLILFFFGNLIVMFFIEKLLPRDHQTRYPKNLGTNFVAFILNVFVLGVYFKGIFIAGILYLLETNFQTSVIYPALAKLPLILQFLFALLLIEFIKYWFHRWQHTLPFLWRFHRYHHDVKELTVTNIYRSHPITYFMRNIIPPALVFFLGFSPVIAYFITLFSAIIGHFGHSGADLYQSCIGHFLVTNEVHRWHHALDFEDVGYNFGGSICLWDQVFKTYKYEKSGKNNPELGIHNT